MKRNLQDVLLSIKTTGGASYSLHDQSLNPARGYMVSLPNHGLECAIPKSIVDLDLILKEYCTGKQELIFQKHIYIGFWIHEGAIFVDLSMQWDSREVAIAAGIDNNQKAIWDNANKCEIFCNAQAQLEIEL